MSCRVKLFFSVGIKKEENEKKEVDGVEEEKRRNGDGDGRMRQLDLVYGSGREVREDWRECREHGRKGIFFIVV